MRVIIAGSRTITDYAIVSRAIEKSGFAITEVVCGCARGVDLLGLRWARDRGLPVRMFPANWARDGRAAGPIRNKEMADYATSAHDSIGGLVAVWDQRSKGTANMIAVAKRQGMEIFIEAV